MSKAIAENLKEDHRGHEDTRNKDHKDVMWQ